MRGDLVAYQLAYLPNGPMSGAARVRRTTASAGSKSNSDMNQELRDHAKNNREIVYNPQLFLS